MSKKKNNDIIDLSSGSDEDVVLVKDERNKSSPNVGQEDSFSVSSESVSVLSDNLVEDISINIESLDSDGNVSDVNTGVMVKWKKVTSPKGWTHTMRKYYNKPCMVQRYFDWKTFVSKMRKDNSVKWNISDSDIYSVPFRVKRCLICRQADHLSYKCPKKYANCSMCGTPGHHYSRCPISMCLNCGVRKNSFVDYCSNCDHWKKVKCNSCKRFGHETRNCSDQWRRFHCTINSSQINDSEVTLNNNIQCCNCAKPGHVYEDCKEPYFSGYMPSSSLVGNYGDFNGKFDFKSNSHKQNVPSKRGKRSRTVDISDSEDELIGKKYMKLNVRGIKREQASRRERSHGIFIGNNSPFTPTTLRKIKRKKRGKKNKKKSLIEN